jgi:hypothetical protein
MVGMEAWQRGALDYISGWLAFQVEASQRPGCMAGRDWFGHGGGLQGYISQTWVTPACEMTICVLTISTDGFAGPWVDGAARILRTFETRGAPKRRVRDWSGRWWSSWGAFDLVPMGNVVLTGNIGQRFGQPRRVCRPLAQQGRQDYRGRIRRRQRAAGKSRGGRDGAEVWAKQAWQGRLIRHIGASPAPRQAKRLPGPRQTAQYWLPCAKLLTGRARL